MEKSIKKITMGFIYGLPFGFLSPVPGLSAGTLAIMLNIYDSFFASVSIASAKKNILVIISFLIGLAAGLFGISRIIMFLFDNHYQVVSFMFIGLIAGCLPMMYKKATKDKVKVRNVIISLVTFILMLFLALFGSDFAANIGIEQQGDITPGLLVWFFTASFFSSMAMLIPGVGGSLMMIVFGIYAIYIEAISTLNILLLAVFGISMILGILVGIAIIKKLLASLSQTLYFTILGSTIGSFMIIYSGFSADLTGIVSVVLAILGAVLTYWFSKKDTA